MVGRTTRVETARVRQAAALDGANVFSASARQAEARIASVPGVARARVTILLPGRAVVEVEERVPAVAVTSSAGTVFADAQGLLFGAASGAIALPLLVDETGRRSAGDRIDPALVAATREIAAREPEYFGDAIERIRMTPGFGLVVLLQGGTEIRIGAPQQVNLKLEAARQIVLSRTGKRLDYVDVRNRENPVFAPLN